MSRNELLNKYRNERTVCESYSRVMGYIRNKNSFNTGKQSEAAERVYFTESCACGK
jgi:anaerobic ribonucleoside-triphosphate reductase